MGKISCYQCHEKCKGEVLRVQDRHFHLDCFKCKKCSASLALGGFFMKDGDYYCTNDYQTLFGTKCHSCNQYVEGEVVTALGHTYHQKCFVCGKCKKSFPPGDKVTFDGKECLCQACVPPRSPSNQASPLTLSPIHTPNNKDRELLSEEELQNKFGVKCHRCDQYIVGQVLQAGENHYFHPSCALCSRCSEAFGEGEEMYLHENQIWHPRCGSGQVEFKEIKEQHRIETQYGYSPSLNSSRSSSSNIFFNRKFAAPQSPGLYEPKYEVDYGKVYTYSYLWPDDYTDRRYLRQPLSPKPPKSPQFHRPDDIVGTRLRRSKLPSKKSGMKVLAETMTTQAPRPRSPHMNNEEPIELAHYPDAHPPKPNEVAKIDREDFPAPPFKYAMEGRKRYSHSSADEESDEEKPKDDPKLKKEEEELSKIQGGISQVFLKDIQELSKRRAIRLANMDPRNASRTPSAKVEPPLKLRYDSPIDASPSRSAARPRPWENWDDTYMNRAIRDRGSMGAISGSNAPKPGYGLTPKSATLPAAGRSGGGDYFYDNEEILPTPHENNFTFGDLNRTHSSEIGSRSDYSNSTLDNVEPKIVQNCYRSATISEPYYRSHFYETEPHRRSLPNMSTEPPKIYPAHTLLTTNRGLPPDVDRLYLERHLAKEEFEEIFHMPLSEFYSLPEWRRNDLKRRAHLF